MLNNTAGVLRDCTRRGKGLAALSTLCEAELSSQLSFTHVDFPASRVDFPPQPVRGPRLGRLNVHETGRQTETIPGEGPATPRMLAWAKNSAAYRLSRRMMTEQELANAIARKARQKFEEINAEQVVELVEAALSFGRQVRALDDAAYAEVKARSAALAGRSKRMIARKLSEKGVAGALIQDALGEADDLRAAVVFARKRAFGPFRKVEFDQQRANKELSAFARNGFSLDLARSVMAMNVHDAETILFDGTRL